MEPEEKTEILLSDIESLFAALSVLLSGMDADQKSVIRSLPGDTVAKSNSSEEPPP